MGEMTIQGTAIQIKEYGGSRVITFKDIDSVHHRPDGTARKRFNDNRKHFIEGVDFFKTKCSEVCPKNGQTPQNGYNPNAEVTLLTETGYLMLVKSFTDDLAWKVQRELVDGYFRAKLEPDREAVQKVLAEGIPTVVIDTDKLIKCAEIMAGCLDSNRPYVLNILKNLIPSVDDTASVTEVVVETETGTKALPDVSEKAVVKRKTPCPGVGIDTTKMLLEMNEQGISMKELASKANVSVRTIMNWIAGIHNPVIENRDNICDVLGKDRTFLTPRRKRKEKP